MTDLNQMAEEHCRIMARIEGWTSAPVREEYVKAGFLAGYHAGIEASAKVLQEIQSSAVHQNCRKHYIGRIRALLREEGK